MNKYFTTAAMLAALASPAFAQPPVESFWDHNGSLMRAVDDGLHIKIFYQEVRQGLTATIAPGSIAFEGTRVNGNGIVGNAFVYTKYCPGKPFPYRMSGSFNGVIDVRGPAPVVDPNVCRIIGFAPNSDNAHRVFRALPPPVAIQEPPPPPPVVIERPPVFVPPPPVQVPVQPPASGPSNNNNIVVVPSGPVTNNNNITIHPPTSAQPQTTAPRQDRSPDEQAEDLKRQGQEFCWKYPGHPVCNGQGQAPAAPPAATPLSK